MWIENLETARANLVADVSLFMVGMDDETEQMFLQFWNSCLERDIALEPPTSKSLFIWRLIDATMRRAREIDLGAGQQSTRLN